MQSLNIDMRRRNIILLLASVLLLVAGGRAADPEYKGKEKPLSKYNPATKFYEPVRCGKSGASGYTCYRLPIQLVIKASNVSGPTASFTGTIIDVRSKATVGEWAGITIAAGDGSMRLVQAVYEFGPELDDAFEVSGSNKKLPDGSNKDQDRILVGGNGRFTGAVGVYEHSGSLFAKPATVVANVSLWVPQLPEMY